ncbi:hypothetical protein DN824_21990 [Stutzerimonas nosocomialis]|uniref:hypothetical protein n=1 Tax=Stutzerimonas nosocomialis TaxID=1056496 RepID=UPI0011093DE4|nr:hypothetical protein [Stutzerimonas nosocomialis]TLX52782.1 hypothetical protein DN824_21990 [Stutzerimonas nosocomialis]
MDRDYCEMAANGMIHAAQEQFQHVAACLTDYSVMYRPALSIDGNKWCALYGENLQDGVAGFGDSPAEAMQDFNREFSKRLEARAK